MRYLHFLIMVQSILYRHSKAYTFHCPFHAQWNVRAKEMCNITEGYLCLYDGNNRVNVEACMDKPKFDTPGYKLQILGSLEGVQCASNRYQPITFWTNGSNVCKFEKSICTDEGQISFSFGSPEEDRTCRCDFTKGYDFVVKPKHPCFCMPTEEDCSCFIRQCPSGFVLSPDYTCVTVEELLENSLCIFPTSSVENTKTQILSRNVLTNNPNYYDVHVFGWYQIPKIVVSVLVLLVIGFWVVYPIIESIIQRQKFQYNLQKRPAIAISESTSDMKSMKDYLTKFEPTHASEELFLAFTEHPCVLITGPFGSGKTTIAYYLISKLEKEGYEIIFASHSADIETSFNRNQRQLFLMDDILGKYSSNISDVIDKLERCGSTINSILDKSDTFKLIITCRTYIFQLYAQYFESLRKQISFIHKNLISENLRLNLKERRKMYKSYFESDPPELISDSILSMYQFYPLLCSSLNKENVLEYFKNPDKIVAAEISGMRRLSDTGYLALAILVVFNNRVENEMLFGMNNSQKTDEKVNMIFRDIFNESCFNQYPSKHLMHITFMSLKGEFVKDDEKFLSFLCPELFDVVASCIGGSFMHTILTHSSSVFIKEKLQLSTPQGDNCSNAIRVQQNMEDQFYRRLISDMKNDSILDVLSNKLFNSHENRMKLLTFLRKHVNSKMLVDAATGSNVLHIVSSLGYSDLLTHFLACDKHQGLNNKNIRGESPLQLACQNGHLRCVECIIKHKPTMNGTDRNKRTALHYVCESGHENIIKCLVTNHASINYKDFNGMTPLHLACVNGHLNVVRYLVEKKANINEADKKWKTSLHYSCQHGMCDIANILILNKAHVNKSDAQGSTPLHIACESGNEEIVKLLVKNKAVTNCMNKQGMEPLDIALQNSFDTIVLFLLQCKTNK